MSVASTVLSGATSLVGGLVGGYFIGRVDAHRRNKQEQCQTLLNNVTEAIRQICSNTRRYLTESNTPYERLSMRTEIQIELKRLRTDIGDLVEAAGKNDHSHTDPLISFHEAITTEPFGDTEFSPLEAWSERVRSMEKEEGVLISCLRRIARQ